MGKARDEAMRRLRYSTQSPRDRDLFYRTV